LLGSPEGLRVRQSIESADIVAIPHLCSVETASVLRSLVRGGKVEPGRAAGLLADVADLPLVRYSHEPLLLRIWELRENLTAYDAAYVALAEAVRATLVTCDARLGRAPLTGVTVEVIARPSEN
jgi:predicted nucleic acid-binding protein